MGQRLVRRPVRPPQSLPPRLVQPQELQLQRGLQRVPRRALPQLTVSTVQRVPLQALERSHLLTSIKAVRVHPRRLHQAKLFHTVTNGVVILLPTLEHW